MTTQQPEALRLAYAICDYSRYGFESEQLAKLRRMKANTEAAAELRRLHEINSELCRKANTLTILSARDADKITALEAINQELLAALKALVKTDAPDQIKSSIWKQAFVAINKAERTTP